MLMNILREGGRRAATSEFSHVLSAAGLLTLILVMPGTAGARGAEPAAIMSPEELWRDFNPEALPLDEQPVRRFDHAGIEIEAVRFTGEVVDGAKISVFALRGAPAGGKNLPGGLHVHGGGQPASAEGGAYWVK